MKRTLAAAAILFAWSFAALAQSGTSVSSMLNATTPCPPQTYLYLDQQGVDVKLDCSQALAAMGLTTVPLAVAYKSPADPAGIAGTTRKMLGLGAAAAATVITPTGTGRVHSSVVGDVANATSAAGVNFRLKYGTGTPPANGDAETGTDCGALKQAIVQGTTSVQPFGLECYITGLSIGTQVWFDIAASATTSGTALVTAIDWFGEER